MVSFLVLSRRVTGQRDRYSQSRLRFGPSRFTPHARFRWAEGMCLEISPNTNARIGFENGQLSSP